MLQLPDKINVRREADRLTVEARIVELTRPLAKSKIDVNWWQDLGVPTQIRKNENDNSWQWAKRLGELRQNRWHEAVAVETEDGEIQGAILYWLNTGSLVDREKGAVHVEALATAPRNRPWLVSSPVYRGIGENLLLRTTLHSYVVGFKGRLNLLSFPDERTISFYENRRFEIVGEDDGLVQMELPSSKALEWLREEGYDL
jgi:hypothetical protein